MYIKILFGLCLKEKCFKELYVRILISPHCICSIIDPEYSLFKNIANYIIYTSKGLKVDRPNVHTMTSNLVISLSTNEIQIMQQQWRKLRTP